MAKVKRYKTMNEQELAAYMRAASPEYDCLIAEERTDAQCFECESCYWCMLEYLTEEIETEEEQK